MDPVTGDFNNDGHADIVINSTMVSRENVIALLLGHGDGTFDESSQNYPLTGFRVTVGDLNNDGLSDLAVAGEVYWPSVLFNTTVVP